MAFLDDLSNALFNQIGLAENTPGNLDHKGQSFGRLGEFASVIDKTAQRSYVETGVIRNIRPRASEILMQEPDVTVVVKKRLFSSLTENYASDLMDEEELLFLRATKKLFYNKCRIIAAYERLSKFDRIAQNDGQISDFALPLIFNALDAFSSSPLTSNIIDDGTRAKLELIRKVKKFSDSQIFTTWNVTEDLPYASATGQGTGTFDLTLVTNISTTVSTQMGQGKASFNIEDPYGLLTITERDIEEAIADSVNLLKQNSFFSITENQLEATISDLKDNLNSIRLNRGAPRIIFKVEPNTLLYKKVRAIIDEEGKEIQFNFDAGTFGSNLFSFDNSSVVVDPSALQGNSGLQGSEVDLFKQILNNVYILLGLKETTKSEIKEYNAKTNYLRKKMMLHYHRKSIIQPMDVIYVYVTSKTLVDSKISQGLASTFASNSLLNSINQSVSNIEASFDDLIATFSGGNANTSFLEQEKNAIAGPEFPLWLYSLLRNDFTRQSAGTAVFVGLVDRANRSYSASSGKYSLSVSASDNTKYLKVGNINVNPSVEVYNSSLYDPLTPFKPSQLGFEESSGLSKEGLPPLLDANIRLLNSRSIRSKFGRFRNSGMNEELYNVPDTELTASSSGPVGSRGIGQQQRRKLFDPDGFVYRWKEGIGSLVIYGEPHSSFVSQLGSFRKETSPNITRNPFAGQDVMNVISLLITGKPYNFNTFVRGAIEFGQLNRNDLTNDSLSQTFFRSLIDDIAKQNATWGNFIPFKKLIINERGYDFLASGQFDLIVKNEELNKLLRQRAQKFDELNAISSGIADTPQYYNTGSNGVIEANPDVASTTVFSDLRTELSLLDKQIKAHSDDFYKTVSQPANLRTAEGTLSIIGDDISFDPSITNLDSPDTESKKRRERSEFRNRLNQLTLRRLWKVRGNEDPNLFIVDDSYDKNYDIQAFEKTLANRFELFNSSYSNPFEQVDIVSKFLGLEVFADSQGHVQTRPPQYNRMPSSVFAELLRKKADKGIQIFPSYLESLFFTSIQGLTDELEIVEDQIRLKAAAIGKTTDDKIISLFGNNFKFLTSRGEGKLNNDIRLLLEQDAPDLQEERNSKALVDLSNQLSNLVNATVNFSVVDRTKLLLSDSESFVFDDNISVSANNVIQQISTRLEQKTGQKQPNSLLEVLSNNRATNERKQTDILKITNDLSQYVAERQRLIKTLSRTVKNLVQGVNVNADGSKTAQALLYPDINKSAEIPEILEHMIENENIHDLGPRAGERYIIRDNQILSLEITEEPPPFCTVQVDGRLESGLVDLHKGLDVGNGGNAMGTAWAVDYDLWQMYGFRAASPQTIPFFSDPNTQCAPYAVYMLNLARKNIFQGSLSIAGNEFIQAGEVYYVESENLLVYAESVSHSFAYSNTGGSFTTNIRWTYGHSPGEYIPTPLDIIGKGLYSHRQEANRIRNVRHGRADSDTHLVSLVHDANTPVFSGTKAMEALVGGQYGEFNKKSLANILLLTEGIINTSTYGKESTIEIRTYFNTDPQVSLDNFPDLEKVANSIKAWLINPTQFSLDGESLLPAVDSKKPVIPPDRVKVVAVDLKGSLVEEYRSPSSKAWNLARDIIRNSNIPISKSITAATAVAAEEAGVEIDENQIASDGLTDAERRVLMASIIDVWVTFKDSAFIIQGSKSDTDPTNQAEQQQQDVI